MDDLQDEAIEPTVTEESDSHGEETLAKRFKDSQAHISKIQNENKELRSRLDQLTGRFEQLGKQEPREPEKLWIDEIDDEAIRDDPSQVKAILKRQRQEFAELLELRDRAIAEHMKGYDPERRSMADKIAKLKEDPELKDLSDDALLVIAKKFAKDEIDEDEQVVRSHGAPIGAKRNTVARKEESREDKLKKFSPYFDRMYGKKKSVYGGNR